MDELENIMDIYWSRVVVLGEKNIRSFSSINPKDESIRIDNVPNEIPQMCRQTILTDVQQGIIKQLFEYKINFLNSLLKSQINKNIYLGNYQSFHKDNLFQVL